ncbi:MAG TPA: MFS transporter [Actinomycetota bacterium]|jgi:MFS family permease|nr:MFS transporter [Actinomycetota bacterium]
MPLPLPSAVDALRERDFRLLYVGQSLSNLGSALVPVALAFAVLDLTGSATDLGLVLLAARLPLALLVIFGGVLGDRLPRRWVMVGSDLVRCATQAVTAGLLLSGTARLWELAVLQAVHGAAAAFFDPAATGLVSQTVATGRLQQANSLLGLSRSASAIVGQLVAGVLVATVGSGIALTVDAASFAASAWSLALLRLSGTTGLTRRSRFLHDLAEGWGEFRTRRWLWASVVHVALLNLVALAPLFVLGPLVAKRSLGGAGAWAIIGAGYATGAVVGGLLGLRWRPRRPLLASVVVVFALAPLLAGLAIPVPLVLLAGAAVLAGLQASLSGVLSTTTLQQHVPAQVLSRTSAYGMLGALVFVPLGYALAGPVADWIGLATTLWVGAVWVAASTVAVAIIPSVRRLPQVDPEPIPEPAPSA